MAINKYDCINFIKISSKLFLLVELFVFLMKADKSERFLLETKCGNLVFTGAPLKNKIKINQKKLAREEISSYSCLVHQSLIVR